MSHRSSIAARRNELQAAPIPKGFPNKQPAPGPNQVTFDKLIPMLVSAGAGLGYGVDWTNGSDGCFVTFRAQCGPVEIPFRMTKDEALLMAQRIVDAASMLLPPAVAEPMTLVAEPGEFQVEAPPEAIEVPSVVEPAAGPDAAEFLADEARRISADFARKMGYDS